jgi:phi13 family phage major tail protein
MGRIRYGIKNAYYAVATDDGSGNLTYASPVAIPGAKSISLDAQGDAVDEFADNTTWWHGDVNNGYSGSIEFEDTAALETFLTSVLGQTKDSTTGVITEKASDTPKEFALGFQFELAGGTETGKRVWLVRCTASRPSISGQTKESSIAVQTNTINIKAVPRIADDVVKYSCVSTDSDYTNWFSAVEQATT